jgi:hypothetical protein
MVASGHLGAQCRAEKPLWQLLLAEAAGLVGQCQALSAMIAVGLCQCLLLEYTATCTAVPELAH